MPIFNAPAWLKERQIFAVNRGASLGWPQQADEAWRYTPVHKFLKKEWSDVRSDQSQFVVPPEVSELVASADHSLFFYNGVFLTAHSKVSLQEDLLVAPLGRVLMSAGRVHEQAKFLLDREPNKNLKALGWQNEAKYRQGAFVHMRGAALQTVAAIHLYGNLQNSEEQSPFLVCPKNIYSCETNSKVEIVEAHLAVNSIEFQVNNSSLISLAEGAEVAATQIIWMGHAASVINDQQVVLNKNSRLNYLNFTNGGRLVRNELDVLLQQTGAQAYIYSLTRGSAEDHIDNNSFIHHMVGETKSDQVAKTLLSGKSRAIFSGRLFIEKNAQKSDAHQLSQNILLSDEAEADTRPQLEVLADDVKAAHGATVGQLSENEIFYLMSRAISREQAQGMILAGEQNSMIEKMPAGFVRAILQKFITRDLE